MKCKMHASFFLLQNGNFLILYRHALTTPSLPAESSSLTPPWPTIDARAVIESLCARLAAVDSTLKGSMRDDGDDDEHQSLFPPPPAAAAAAAPSGAALAAVAALAVAAAFASSTTMSPPSTTRRE